jgi:DNA-directed RNA polymerase specialized sigma24 family protein
VYNGQVARRDPQKIFADLKKADERVDAAAAIYAAATASRTALILEAADFGLSRGTIARELEISPNRVQQIIDRARARSHQDPDA